MRIRSLQMDRFGNVRPYLLSGTEPIPGSRIVLLVHGYNNDESQAATSYLAMRQNLDTLLQSCGVAFELREHFQLQIWELYWPGYFPLTKAGSGRIRRPGWEKAISAPSYSLEVIKAKGLVADNLAKYLTARSPLTVFFIAHSLGCRVVLEVLQRLSTSNLSAVTGAGYLLMAGAVAIDQLADRGRLGSSARQQDKRYCLHSWRDSVLLGAFPSGQLMAGEVPVYGVPIATGLTGRPNIWTYHANTRLQHGAYWEEGLRRDLGVTCQLCQSIFGLAIPRPISTSNLYSLPSARALSILPERTLSSAGLRGDRWIRDRFG